MIPIGETLRRERLRRNLDLEKISSELKIAPRFLEAIEAEKFEQLPGPVFARAFVRQYARLLELDGQELAGQIQHVLEPATQSPQLSESPRNGGSTIHVPRIEVWESASEQRFRWPSWIPAAGLVVLAMLACSGIYAWLQRDRHTVIAQTPPAAAAQPAPTVPETALPPAVDPKAQTADAPAAEPPPSDPPAAAPAAAPESAAPAPAAVPLAAAPVAEPNPDATVHLTITADEQVWVSARADGKYLFSATLAPNQSRTVEAADILTLRLGNAGGVNITLNGKPIEKVGARGQARTVQFTSGGFQIVAPPKPSLVPPAPI